MITKADPFVVPIQEIERNHKYFFSKYSQGNVVESLRNKSPNTDIISGAKTLQSYIKLFKFPLEESICNAKDVATQSNIVVSGSWHIFMKQLCGKRSSSNDFDRSTNLLLLY